MRNTLLIPTLAALLSACAVAQSPAPDGGPPEPPRDMLPPLDRDPMPAAEPEPEPQPEPDPEPQPEPDPEPQPEPDPEPAPEGEPDPEPAPEGEPDPEPQPEPDPEPQPEPEPDPEPIPEPEPDPEPDAYPWLIIVDDSQEDSGQGTAGIDLCGASARCPDFVGPAEEARAIQGDGLVCSAADGPPCSGTARNDPDAALDIGDMCEAGSAPSDYVSLGMQGQIALRFPQSLVGCEVSIVEFAGRDLEPYDAYVCQSSDLAAETCLLGGAALLRAANGGRSSVRVPAP